jgi:hypothetical protein
VLNQPAYRERADPRRGRQFRLRLLARARALGAARFRHPLRDRHLLRRHLLQQLLQERHPADRPAAGRRGQADGRRPRGANATVTVDLEARTITGPDGGVIKFESTLPQALPAERPRRHRPDHGVLEQDIGMPDFLKAILSSGDVMPDSIAWRFWINNRNNRTEFHYDTNAENVITVQVKGRKEWVLVSPETPLPCYPFTNFGLLRDEAQLLKGKLYYKFDLEEGDLLYVPPLWYHRAVAKEEENININWTFTKRHTSVVTREFRRDVERCGLLDSFKHHKSALVRNSYSRIIRALPNVGGIGWGLKAFISSPYKPGRRALVKRFFAELLRIPGTLMTLPNVRATLRKVDKT